MDLFLRSWLILLLFFLVFSFAGAQPWAFSVFQGGLVLLAAGLCFSRQTLIRTPLFTPLFYTMSFMIVLALIQCIAPQTLLDTPAWHPSTLIRLYTLDHASYLATWLLLSFCVMQLADNSTQSGRLVWAAVICAVAVSCVALGFSQGEYMYILTGKHAGYGPFFNRNHGGLFLAACAVLAAGWSAAAWTGLVDKTSLDRSVSARAFWVKQAWKWLAAITIGVAAVFSRSRGAMLALAAGISLLGLLCALTLPQRRKTRLCGALLILILGGVAGYWAATHVDTINTFAHRRTHHDTSVSTRQLLYRGACDILKEYPVWGVGIGALPLALPSYMDKPLNSYVERLHNDWLEMFAGMGYVGGGITGLGFWWFMIVALRRLNGLETRRKLQTAALFSALWAVCIGACVDFPFFIPATAALFFWVAGLLCAPPWWKEQLHRLPDSRVWRVIVLVLSLAACWVPLQKTRAWREVTFGKSLQPQARIVYYQKALAAYPDPRAAVRLGNTYYNASLRATDPAEKQHLRKLAFQTATAYLQQYPKDKALSRLYLLSRPQEDISN